MKLSVLFLSLILSLSSLAQSKNMTIVLDKDLEDIMFEDCFGNWEQQLKDQGYNTSISIVNQEDQNLKNYKRIISAENPNYLFLLGDIKLPKRTLLQKDKYDRSKNKLVTTETIFPLYSKRAFPQNGVKGAINFFKNANISIGALNLVYERSTKYSHTGLLKRYCEYFNKVTQYKACEKEPNIKAAAMIDSDFSQLKGDIKTLTKNSKRYSSFQDIMTGDFDFTFLAAHANSKKIYYGKNEKQQTLTVTSLLKTKIKTKFFNLYSCRVFEDNGKYSVGKAFIGKHSETLGVLGSTKSGALAYPKIYFDLLKKGYTFGEALLRYVKYYATYYGGSESYLDNNGYHSGLIFYGDPTQDLHRCKKAL